MPTPATPINTPATAGPTIRAALNMDELSAIAFMRSSLPTSSTMNAWRAGMSNALTTPKNTASAMTCHVVTLPVHTSTASASASSICRACVHTMRRRLSTRSTTTPAYSVNSSTPRERSACVKPTANGELVMSVALGWLVLDITNSPFAVGLTQALRSLGVLLFTLYAGVVVDRVDKRRLIVWTQALLMLEALALAALVWTGRVTTWQVMVLALFFGIVNAFDIPARQAFIAELVGREDLMNAIALNSSIFNAARIVGPAVAGVVIGTAGVGMCFFLNGVSYIAVIAGLLAMRLPSFVPNVMPTSAREGVRQAVTFIRGDARG